MARFLIAFLAACLIGFLVFCCGVDEPDAPTSSPVPASTLGDAVRGKHLYERGESLHGDEVVALLGNPPNEVPGSVLRCVNCHGRDGRGKAEGGIVPADIYWHALTKPYGETTPGGHTRPAYDALLVQRAIAMGLDPGGEPLHVSMPRYRLSTRDMADLLAHLRQLGVGNEVGVTDSEVHIGVFRTTMAIEDTAAAFVSHVNEAGGVFGRKLVLHVERAPTADADALRAFLDRQPLFALLALDATGMEREVSAIIREHGVPVIGQFGAYPQLRYPLNPWIFHLQSGVVGQARALASFSLTRFPHVVVLHDGTEGPRQAAEAFVQMRGQQPELRTDVQQVASMNLSELSAKDAVLLLLAAEDATRAIRVLPEGASCLVPVGLSGPHVLSPDTVPDVYFARPAIPALHSPAAAALWQELQPAGDPDPRWKQQRFATIASGLLFLEAVKRCGRRLTRGQLVDTLETFVDFETGLLQPLTFGPNRRVGSPGANILRLRGDKLERASGWIGPPTRR